jgi:hypothetical protein
MSFLICVVRHTQKLSGAGIESHYGFQTFRALAMGTSYNFGQAAEQVVAIYLQSRGGKIMTRRWLCKVGEIDLIAELG